MFKKSLCPESTSCENCSDACPGLAVGSSVPVGSGIFSVGPGPAKE